MFPMLGSEFALILYDGKRGEVIAARDPIGIRPLYYGEDEFGEKVFASEPKDLVELCAHVHPFPPGCYYRGGEFHRYMDVAAPEGRITGSVDEVCKGIHHRLVKSVEDRMAADAPLGFLLSGGALDVERASRIVLDEFRGGKIAKVTLDRIPEI
jgi:asparagine synthase (glutamine-hydrolysing)